MHLLRAHLSTLGTPGRSRNAVCLARVKVLPLWLAGEFPGVQRQVKPSALRREGARARPGPSRPGTCARAVGARNSTFADVLENSPDLHGTLSAPCAVDARWSARKRAKSAVASASRKSRQKNSIRIKVVLNSQKIGDSLSRARTGAAGLPDLRAVRASSSGRVGRGLDFPRIDFYFNSGVRALRK